MTINPRGFTARSIDRDLALLADIVHVLERIETVTYPTVNGRICPTCGGLRGYGRRPCDVCQAIKRGEELGRLIEDVEWLIGTDNPENISRRVGYSNQASLARRLNRNGRPDLARVFEQRHDKGVAA